MIRPISSSILTTTLSSNNDDSNNDRPKIPNKEDLQFGKTFSSHMLQIPYAKGKGGWQAPEIMPYQELKLSPAASSLHYGELRYG